MAFGCGHEYSKTNLTIVDEGGQRCDRPDPFNLYTDKGVAS